jgi:hypothetical protein
VDSEFEFANEKNSVDTKESCHWIEKRILYKMNHIFISNIQNLANYLEKMLQI